jgi:hypothetical protein
VGTFLGGKTEISVLSATSPMVELGGKMNFRKRILYKTIRGVNGALLFVGWAGVLGVLYATALRQSAGHLYHHHQDMKRRNR